MTKDPNPNSELPLTPAKERRIAVILLLTHTLTHTPRYPNYPKEGVPPTIKELYESDDRMPGYKSIVDTHFRHGAIPLGLATLTHPTDNDEDSKPKPIVTNHNVHNTQKVGEYLIYLTPKYYQSHFWTHSLYANQGRNSADNIPFYLSGTEHQTHPHIDFNKYIQYEQAYKRKYDRERRAWDTR